MGWLACQTKSSLSKPCLCNKSPETFSFHISNFYYWLAVGAGVHLSCIFLNLWLYCKQYSLFIFCN